MKIQRIAIVLSFCFCTFLARAQYYWYGPPGAGPYFRMGVGPTIYQDGTLKGYTLQGTPAFSAQNKK
jgi:hypothetical protein